MKKLMPIPKLYNFNPKVLQNLSKIFFFLICFFSLISLTTVFSIYKVEAVGVTQVVVGDQSYDVYYIGSSLGSGTEIPPHESNIDGPIGNEGCYYNGVDNSAAPIVAYNSEKGEFNTLYSGEIAPIVKNSTAAKALAKKGFCAGIKKCKMDASFIYFRDKSARLQYEFFKDDGDWGKLYFRYSSRRSDEYLRGGWGTTIDPSLTRPATVEICNNHRVDEGSLPWLTKGGEFFRNCHDAIKKTGKTEDEAYTICAEFVCIKRPDVKSDWQGKMLSALGRGGFNYDEGTDRKGTCTWLRGSTECTLVDERSCIYDNDTSTLSTNCESENKTLDSDSLGLPDPYKNKKIFCSPDNKPVHCPERVSTYSAVFEADGRLKSSTGCELFPDSMPGCRISDSNPTCTFGNPGTSDNCFDNNEIGTYAPRSGGSSLNLFCTPRNRAIACQSSITTYRDAFPGTTDRSGTFTPKAGDCSEFEPGMEDIAEIASGDCIKDEEGEIFLVGGESGTTRFTPEQQREYTRCLASEVRSRSSEDASETCQDRFFGAGVPHQCLCDVSYNPEYDFWRCNVAYEENSCGAICVLQETTLSEIKELKTQEAVSPLGLIRSISDFLFAIAVLIFIINMLRASFMYVTSGGDEGKMKEAQSTITNTIFGMVFIVFIGALLRWVITIATTATTATP